MLPPIQSKLIKVLIENKRYYRTTSFLAKKTKISWNTALFYLKQFEEEGWVSVKKSGENYLWKANVSEDYKGGKK